MLKIYFNEQPYENRKLKLLIRGDFCQAEVTSGEGEEPAFSGVDCIEEMMPYNSYALTMRSGIVKNFRRSARSDYRWLNLNRLGVSTKMDFGDITSLYGFGTCVQIDTGVMNAETRDIIVRVFFAGKEGLTIEADQEYELAPFNPKDLVLGSHPRFTLWDSYSLSAAGREWMSDRYGYTVDGDFTTPLILPAEQDYFDFVITKYKSNFTGKEKLARDIDDEEVLVESSAGLVNNRRVRLQNGTGSFRLYPFGHEGLVKIKLGRKWYEVWNEYLLTIGGAS